MKEEMGKKRDLVKTQKHRMVGLVGRGMTLQPLEVIKKVCIYLQRRTHGESFHLIRV